MHTIADLRALINKIEAEERAVIKSTLSFDEAEKKVSEIDNIVNMTYSLMESMIKGA